MEEQEEEETDLVGGHGQAAVQVLHQLFEGWSLGGNSVPAVPHHHVPAQRSSSSETGAPYTQQSQITAIIMIHAVDLGPASHMDIL